MCRSLAGLLREWGREGDAEAVDMCELILRRPADIHIQREVQRLLVENDQLRQRIQEFEREAIAR
jgi:hypothetical protein